MVFSAEFMIAMISSALFIDGKLERRLKNTGQKQPHFNSLGCEMARQSHWEEERL